MVTMRTKEDEQPKSTQPVLLSDASSRLSPPSSRQHGRERRNPSVTPRKFKKFFAPRSQSKGPASSSRRALNEITASGLNRTTTLSNDPPPFLDVEDEENSPSLPTTKRRKTNHTEIYSSNVNLAQEPTSISLLEEMEMDQTWDHVQSSPCTRPLLTVDESDEEELTTCIPTTNSHIATKAIRPMRNRGLGAQLLSLSIGQGRDDRQRYTYPTYDYRSETANFASEKNDVHMVSSFNTPGRRCIPFCVTPCNTNSLIALGDEEGRVRLIETNKDEKPEFDKHFLTTRVHMNAVMDMSFSADDRLLATGGGDQTCRVVDMSTQTTLAILAGHSASLKQVRFQPGDNNNNILATSSRDGVVRMWDLRCKGDTGPQHKMYLPVENNVRVEHASTRMLYARPVNTIYDAHRTWNFGYPLDSVTVPRASITDVRAGPVSVTAMEFLPAGREHFFLTGCEADSSVRLWDIRYLYSKTKASPTPISVTKIPDAHNVFRHYGINSINISTDGSRFYTLCKDHTVYAYSTAHLITGTAPELASTTRNRTGPQRKAQEGLGPMYGYRHPQLHCTSFYTKSAIRTARNGQSEMLAVGSNDQVAVLFPTDERYLPKSPQHESTATLSGHNNDNELGPPLQDRPALLHRASSSLGMTMKPNETMSISTNGTPLVRGHTAEVNGLTWSHNGSLVTIGDDYLVRCWREGDAARRLRTGGESQGRRWLAGWADVEEAWDQEDFDEV